MKNTPNMNLNHFITPCKPPACSNTTTHHKTNFQHQKFRVLQEFKLYKILFITSNQQYSFNLNTHSNQQSTRKSNTKHHNYNAYKYWNLLFITSNQQYPIIIQKNVKHSQYIFKPPYNIMQAARLLQHNIAPQIQFPTSQE